jgi:hypothetical protein
MSTFTTSMFASIKDALQKDTKPGGGMTDIMRLEKGNSYIVRLLPNTKDPAKTFFHYYVHGFESLATGRYMSLVSPQTFGERDPIAEFRYKVNRTGTTEEKEKAKGITRLEKWLVNVHVIDDPSNPENNGKVKVLRYGKQLHNIIMEAIEGEDAGQLGERIFDTSENGCSLRVKVEDQGGFPTYVSSKFLMPGPVDGLTAESAQAAVDDAADLDSIFNIKSYNELQADLNEHFHCIDTSDLASSPVAQAPVKADPMLTEDVSFDTPAQSVAVSSETTVTPSDSEVDLNDDKIKELLQGLDE